MWLIVNLVGSMFWVVGKKTYFSGTEKMMAEH